MPDSGLLDKDELTFEDVLAILGAWIDQHVIVSGNDPIRLLGRLERAIDTEADPHFPWRVPEDPDAPILFKFASHDPMTGFALTRSDFASARWADEEEETSRRDEEGDAMPTLWLIIELRNGRRLVIEGPGEGVFE